LSDIGVAGQFPAQGFKIVLRGVGLNPGDTEIGSVAPSSVHDGDLITGVQITESVEHCVAATNLIVSQHDCYFGRADLRAVNPSPNSCPVQRDGERRHHLTHKKGRWSQRRPLPIW
jgi:hypothetical protein